VPVVACLKVLPIGTPAARFGRLPFAQMTGPPRNPSRAYDAEGHEIRPMSLGNMREHGVRSVLALC
jgi:hypothetical protein